MNRMTSLAAILLLAASASAADMINGAGATFPYPIYSKWFDTYAAAGGARINYQSIGSGGGIRQITEHTVDFGATDGPMTEEQMMKLDAGLVHIPTVLGAVVPVYNLKGVESLTLSGELIADIYLGLIKKWNDPRIAALNPGAALPDTAITVVRRSDGSGTTYCFTDYLSKVSKAWKDKAGKGTAVSWPVGIGGKGNEGVAGLVKLTPGSIGYVELIYAKQNNIAYAAVKNKAGKTVKATVESITAAAASAKMPKDYRVSIVDAPGEASYPISTYTWLLVYEKNAAEKGAQLKAFLQWMLKEGQGMAPALGYAPLPDSVKAMVVKTVEKLK